jgi:NAD(P)-dependent dehydrogenase (short-subunit alcohol dehydrogenase family)
MPEVAEQTLLVTGSTDGLGRQVAARLVERSATVLVHGRDPARVEQVRAEIGAERGYVADLASLAESRRLAEEVGREHERLDVLVNNAGILGTPSGERELSDDGYELHFAVNYLAGFVLTLELLPLLIRSAPARVVNVSSGAQRPIDFDDVMLERGYDHMRAYSQSKLAQVMFTFELAERLRREGQDGVAVTALHPASLMDTKMVRSSYGTAWTSVEEGGAATLRLVVDAPPEEIDGRYFEGRREAAANRQAYDERARRRLWELSEELTALPARGHRPAH